MRGRHFDLFAADLAGRATPVLRETGMKRNDLVLLSIIAPQTAAASASPEHPITR
jgi:hypothetical protein